MWLYKGREINDEDIPSKAAGFIYIMIYKPNGKRYIGRKLLTKAHTRQKNGKKIRSRIESDWRDYWSSSPDIKKMIEDDGGTHNFSREILIFADTKGQLNYLEEKFLYCLGSIETTDYINSNIRSKMYKRNILGKLNLAEVNASIISLQQNKE